MTNPTLNLIHSMYTTHGNFTDQEISDSDLQTILSATVRAATASNRQSYSIIVIRDPEKMLQLCGYSGSRALLFCVDSNRLNDMAAHLGYEADYGGSTMFVTGCIDTALAAQTAILAAQSLGIATLPTNGIHRGDIRRIYQLLNLPQEHCFPLLMLVLGYADQKPQFLKGRLDGAGVIHDEEYRRLTPQQKKEIVKIYDDPQYHMDFNQSWRTEGYPHYLDWFHQVWMARFRKPGADIPGMQQILAQSDFSK